jgi:hypothetical protein
VGTGQAGRWVRRVIPLTAIGPWAAFFVVGSGIVTAAITGNRIVLVSFRQTHAPPRCLAARRRVSGS